MDKIPHEAIGVVIDAETQIPIDHVLVKDSKSGHWVQTDSSGRFRLVYFNPSLVIEISGDGYKPFLMEVRDEYDDNHVKFKSLKLRDERIYHDKTHEEKEINSNSVRVVNGDSLVIELKRIK